MLGVVSARDLDRDLDLDLYLDMNLDMDLDLRGFWGVRVVGAGRGAGASEAGVRGPDGGGVPARPAPEGGKGQVIFC